MFNALMTLGALQAACARRSKRVFPECADWTTGDWATAAAGELGEACNLIKKRRRGEEVQLSAIASELADVQCYLTLLAHNLGVDLEAAVREKFNQVSVTRGSDVRL